MDSQQNTTVAWSVAGVLAVLLLIALYFLVAAQHTLPLVLTNGTDQITAERGQIAKDCGTAGDKAACNQDLSDLATILKDFSANVETASSSAAH